NRPCRQAHVNCESRNIRRIFHRRTTLALVFMPILSGAAAAQAPAETPTLETIQVTATRNPKPASAVPAPITTIEGKRLATDTLNVNLPEKLAGVAGVLARERQNYAQDVQVSIRGFGARATFGIRGLRLYLDGIPATMPDGQG